MKAGANCDSHLLAKSYVEVTIILFQYVMKPSKIELFGDECISFLLRCDTASPQHADAFRWMPPFQPRDSNSKLASACFPDRDLAEMFLRVIAMSKSLDTITSSGEDCDH